jgi:ferredoxin
MAKNIVFYFTGTGNSLKAARDVAKNLEDCKVVSMTAYKGDIPSDDFERIGFVFPVYAAGLPHYVGKFISETDFSAGKNAYYFIMVTHGGDRGNSIPLANDLLNKKGIRLNAAFDIPMVDNYIIFDPRQNKDEALKAAQTGIDSACKTILRKEDTGIPKSNPAFGPGLSAEALAGMDKNYRVSENCTGCGICSAVCPVKNITMENNRPLFNHRCEHCLACLHHCPERAINYENRTQNKERYINPEIRLEEIINGNKL